MLTALGLFTVVPVPPATRIDRELARKAIAAFPWVGLLLGSAAGTVMAGASAATGSRLLGAALALAGLAGLTGALHLDGLADTADGLGSRQPPEGALAVMRRSDIGPMGVVSLVFVLLLDVAALASLSSAGTWAGPAAVTVAAMAGRMVVVLATVPAASARAKGFGALVTGVTSRVSAAGNTVAVLTVGAGIGWVALGARGLAGSLFALLAALSVGLAWAAHVRRRLAGYTGDVFGSIVEVSQAVFLILLAVAVRVG